MRTATSWTSIASPTTTRSRSTTRLRTCSSNDDLGVADILEVWRSGPVFYPAKPPADWLMLADIGGRVLVVPLARPDSGDPARCRPIGCYVATRGLAQRYREDR